MCVWSLTLCDKKGLGYMLQDSLLQRLTYTILKPDPSSTVLGKLDL